MNDLLRPVRHAGGSMILTIVCGGSAYPKSLLAPLTVFAAILSKVQEKLARGAEDNQASLLRGRNGRFAVAMYAPPFMPLDEFEPGETQWQANMVETLALGFRGNLLIFAQDSAA